MATAQKYKDYEFPEEVPVYDTSLKQYEEAVIEYYYSLEFKIDENSEVLYNFNMYTTLVNSDDAIEANNKMYLSANNSDYLFQKARVINTDGSIKVLDQDDIKEGTYENEEGNEIKYYYYALEGLERGSIVQQATYQMKRPSYYGDKVYLQGNEFRLKQEFELIAPYHLYFDFKTLNGDFEIQKDTNETEVNRWFVEIDSTEKMKDQSGFYPNVVKQAVLYKLDRNTAQNRSDITTYSNAAPFMHKSVNPELTKKQEKALNKMLKEMDIDDKSELEQIYAIESYVKDNFQIVDNNADQLSDLDFILENNACGPTGVTMLIESLLGLKDIENQLVITTKRSELRFDPEFEAYLFLDKYLIYFPDHELFIAPTNQFGRKKYIPMTWSDNYGLFIRTITVGDISTVVGEIKYIAPLTSADNYDKMTIDVDFSKSITDAKVEITKEMMGYTAKFLQPFYHLMDEEAIGNLKSEITYMVHEDVKSDDVEFTNTESEDYGVNPLVMHFTTTDHPFVEQAGEDYLFKIGELIGPQAEMYQESERQFPIEADNNRSYIRTITFKAPEGYTVKNIEKLNFVKGDGDRENATMYFESKVTEKDGVYTVYCEEFYDKIKVPLDEYEVYAEVINAAADFNKIVLILEKQ
ncbi:MAG: hypothetical protein CMP59_08575 [Flavobacteriales bacterium]|nr:hypothetical protein [Flavobacteriales bacterium]